MAGSIFDLALTLTFAGAFITLALVWIADARSWRRYTERLNHMRALAEEARSYGDVPHVPEEARARQKSCRGSWADFAAPAQVRTTEAIARSHDGGM